MREDLEHNFDIAEFNASCRVMKCARELFPHNEKQEYNITIHNSINPNWKKALEEYKRRSKTKLIYY